MNETCNGDWFADLKLYRCSYNGNFVRLENQPNHCSICGRQCFPKLHSNAKTKIVLQKQVCIPSYGGAYVPYEEHEVKETNPMKNVIINWKLENVKQTRFKNLGYVKDGPGIWRVVTMEDGARVGPCYKTKTELLCDLDRYAKESGYGE